MNDVMFQIVQGIDSLYPYNLDKEHPHIVEMISELWGTRQIDEYLSELMVSSRPGRKGFSEVVTKEINTVVQVRERTRKLPKINNAFSSWAAIDPEHRKIIEQAGYECSTRGYIRAVESCDCRILDAFLKGGAKVNVRDERCWTALIIAANDGNEAITQLLISHGADVYFKDKSGCGPLHWAAFNGHTNVVKLLIMNNSNVNAQSHHGWTSLLQASMRGHTGSCSALIAGGADVNLAGRDGWTPLHKACANGHLEVVSLLLSTDVDKYAKNKEGSTPMMLAIKGKHHAIVEHIKNTRTSYF
jgi:ankyrin repeat protein